MLPMLEDHRELDLSKAMHLPIGLASPLWLPFAAATGAGLTFWWMTRWTRPANLEALLEAFAPPAPAPVEPAPAFVAPPLDTAEAVATQVEETAEAAAETIDAAAASAQGVMEATAKPVLEPATEPGQELAPAMKKKPKPAPEAPLH